MVQVSYLPKTVSAQCLPIFYLTSFVVSLLMAQASTGFASYLLLRRSFLLLPAHLENETSNAALKLRPSVVTIKFVKPFKTVSL